MRLSLTRHLLVLFTCACFSQAGQAAGRLEVSGGWIRAAPPGAMMLAGYAILRNSGDASLTIVGAQSADFGDVSLHQSIEENGVEHMRPLGELAIAPGATVAFAPGGRHFMLMRPTHGLKIDDVVRIRIDAGSGAVATAEFVVREAAPAP